ncbi:5-carboxymethyl-2-hydroxymuconate isomerase [Rhodobacter sp. NTK016B]|uniref:5-carboxymethyl-2-hydroxymuconate Delta-isomerase n=1 Tax=Rhodobacter sp. NTK016B TaxID=2759676 RepID=UPI001A8C38AA|nr:5-carboxymethyl-2-hydroxymuconate Delta-isomerase [Rhodobacter sp. NTK016B]MBN8293149.1 5-carboxymethyl-2-hydroxymuconate isomerase [Rhodobacter sp. NTK016B]
MPHLQIQYSRNLEERLDMPGLLRVLRDAAVETGVFPPAGIRVRAFAADHVLIADGDPKHAFIDIAVRLRGGRSPEDKLRATNHLFAALEAYCAEDLAQNSLMLSLEMRDIDPELSPKTSSIRRFLPKDMQA